MVFYKPPDPLSFPNAPQPYLSPIEKEYMMMFRALEEWHHIPWLDPITKEEYPEVKFSMFKLLEYRNKRIRKDEKEAEAKHKLR
jgi:hypothetical protein